MSLKIDLKIFIFFVLFYLTNQIELYATIMIFCAVHEFGHIFMGLILCLKIEKIEIRPFGLSVSFKTQPEDYNKKIINGNLLEIKKIAIAAAGPLTNLIIILVLLNTNVNFRIALNETIIYSNLLIMLFNLLPIYPLDGGRILKGILRIYMGNLKSQKYIKLISKIAIICLTMVSSITLLYIKNIAIFFIIIYLWLIVIKENRKMTLEELYIKGLSKID